MSDTKAMIYKEGFVDKVVFQNDFSIKSIRYYIKDTHTLHRVDGPAKIDYYQSGVIKTESYWLNGKLHREDGAAWIIYYFTGSIEKENYWYKGKCIKAVNSLQEYLQYVEKMKLLEFFE